MNIECSKIGPRMNMVMSKRGQLKLSDRGAIVYKRMQQHRCTVVDAAAALGMGRNSFYRRLSGEPEFTSKELNRLGRQIRYDFSLDFPGIDPYADSLDLKLFESQASYGYPDDVAKRLEVCMREKDLLQIKTIDLLEQLNNLKDEYYALKASINR